MNQVGFEIRIDPDDASKIVKELYNFEPSESQVQIQNTRKDLEGDITLVVFPFLRFSKK